MGLWPINYPNHLSEEIIMKTLKTWILFWLLCMVATGIYAQTGKKPVTLEDAKLWRRHSVTLSEQGDWYTVLYSLTEKPEAEKSEKNKKELDAKGYDKNDIALYGKDAMTDVLYIRKRGSKKEYLVPRGATPRFSAASDWVAYFILPEPKKDKSKEDKKIVELKNLRTGLTKKWETDATFQFTKDGRFFITSDKSSVSVFDLSNASEYYIADVGEFVLPKDTAIVVYTINSDDLRGNGIYLYDMNLRRTTALTTGGFIYSHLSVNDGNTALAALKYKKPPMDKKAPKGKPPEAKKPKAVTLLTIKQFATVSRQIAEYDSASMQGLPLDMMPALAEMSWSNDADRVFLSIRKKEPVDSTKAPATADKKPTLDVWHWKDKKLVSQQMVEAKRKKETLQAVFTCSKKSLIQLTDNEYQTLRRAPDTDTWAVGLDRHEYISDWDVRRYDLYRINLVTGERTLILKNYNGRTDISPDGEYALFWKEGHYFSYRFMDNSLTNISEQVSVSFVNAEYDQFGATPDYGFGRWVNDKASVVVNHKLDLWQLFLDGRTAAVNLTKEAASGEQIRFRIDASNFKADAELEERYLDPAGPILLSAFNIKTKDAGFYQLTGNRVEKLVYKPASYGSSRWGSSITRAKKADVIVYKYGTFSEYPESYISRADFSKPVRITFTNPQQKEYKWGHSILIDYTNDDGVELQGALTIPDSYKKGSRLPMIVYSYEKLSDGLHRYAAPSIRGAGVSEMLYVSEDYLYLKPDIHFNVGTPHSDMLECVNAAIDKVIELGYADAERIGYIGHSFGGHAAMYMSTQKNRFAALVGGAGVSNLVQGFNLDIVGDGSNEQDYYITQQGRLGVNPLDGLEMYLRESAVFNAKNMNSNLLLYHGTADNVVQWEHSFGFYSILRFLKKSVIFLSFRGEGHGIRQKENRIELQTKLKQFFDHYLKGVKAEAWIEEGVPVKPVKAEPDEKKRSVPDWK